MHQHKASEPSDASTNGVQVSSTITVEDPALGGAWVFTVAKDIETGTFNQSVQFARVGEEPAQVTGAVPEPVLAAYRTAEPAAITRVNTLIKHLKQKAEAEACAGYVDGDCGTFRTVVTVVAYHQDDAYRARGIAWPGGRVTVTEAFVPVKDVAGATNPQDLVLSHVELNYGRRLVFTERGSQPLSIQGPAASIGVLETQASIQEIMMQEIVGDYDDPDEIAEWHWVAKYASFAHVKNGQHGVWEFILNLAMSFTEVPERLQTVIDAARRDGIHFLVFHQGT